MVAINATAIGDKAASRERASPQHVCHFRPSPPTCAIPPSGGMPPYRAKVMSDQELADVYAYIKTFPEPKPVKDIPLLNQ